MSDTNLTAILYKKDDLRLVDIVLLSLFQPVKKQSHPASAYE